MPIEFVPLALKGLVLIRPVFVEDNRGAFVKNFSEEAFSQAGINFTPKENFYSVSKQGVLRGMHFQAPPFAYDKLVYCVHGRIHDVVLDIRIGSPTYGQVWSGELDALRGDALFLPPGFAHGFHALEPDSIVAYSVSEVHNPKSDLGVHWDSFGHSWNCGHPIVSARDHALPRLEDLANPFAFS